MIEGVDKYVSRCEKTQKCIATAKELKECKYLVSVTATLGRSSAAVKWGSSECS